MKYDAELILTEEDLKAGKFEIPIDVAVRLTKQENDNRTIHIRLPNNISNYCFNNNL